MGRKSRVWHSVASKVGVTTKSQARGTHATAIILRHVIRQQPFVHVLAAIDKFHSTHTSAFTLIVINNLLAF